MHVGRTGDRHAPHRRRRADDGRPRPLVGGRGSRRLRRLPARGNGRRGPAVHPLHLRLDRQAQGRAPHHRRLCRVGVDDPRICVRLPAGADLLVRGRHRLGHRPQLYRLWPAGQRRDQRDVRRRAQLARPEPHLAGRRQASGRNPLHRADGAPRADARRRRMGAKDIAQIIEIAWHGWRADQSRGLGLVSSRGRRRALPDRRYLVADRDRRRR